MKNAKPSAEKGMPDDRRRRSSMKRGPEQPELEGQHRAGDRADREDHRDALAQRRASAR